MNRAELVDTWLREERQPFAGWDFSYLDGRLTGEREHWSYLDRAAELMRGSSSVIDMDTGGGEKLLSLREHWPRGSSPQRPIPRISHWRASAYRIRALRL